MEINKIVFILGAGASKPYGFPLGKELANMVCKPLNQNEIEILNECGFNVNDLDKFINELRFSEYNSVDWFLEKRPEYLRIGKALIALKLIPYERPNSLFPPYIANLINEHWYNFILNTLINPKENEVNADKLAFITFNYDRSLEYYIFKSLATRLQSESDAIAALRKIEIIHVHGTLGKPWHKQELFEIEYNPTINAQRIDEAIEYIQIIHEANPSSVDFKQAREVLKNSSRITFLGFGYNTQSIKRLGIFNEPWDEDKRGRIEVTGTALGLSPSMWIKIRMELLQGAIVQEKNCEHSVFQHLYKHFPVVL